MITRDQLTAISADAAAALAAVAQKHNVRLVSRGGTFGATGSIKFDVQPIVGGVAVSREAALFQKYATLFKLEATDLGRAFKLRGEQYTLTGCNSTLRKLTAARVSDGRAYAFPPAAVVLL